MFRYPTNQRLEITLRHLRGETAVSLSRETGISERHIRRWKKIALLAIEERMRRPLTEKPTALYALRMAMDQIRDEIVNWKPDFSKLDPENWMPRRRGPRPEFPNALRKVRRSNPEAPPSSHKPEDGDRLSK